MWFVGKKLGFTIDLGKLHNVSLGQGQESVAELAMDKASREGHWVILQVWICVCVCFLCSIDFNLLFSVEHSPGGQMAGQSGETPGALLWEQSPGLPRVYECRTISHPTGTHHPAGHSGKLHQDHQRAAYRDAGQPTRSVGQLWSGEHLIIRFHSFTLGSGWHLSEVLLGFRTFWTSVPVNRSSRPFCSRCVISTLVWQREGSLDLRAGTENTRSTPETSPYPSMSSITTWRPTHRCVSTLSSSNVKGLLWDILWMHVRIGTGLVCPIRESRQNVRFWKEKVTKKNHTIITNEIFILFE